MDESRSKCYPVVNDPDAMFIMKVDGQDWNASEDTEGTDDIPATFLGETVEPEDQTIQDTENGE